VITFEQAKNLKYGDILHCNHHKNSRGECQRWKVNGKVKLWKRSPDRIYIPLKHGLYDHDGLIESDFADGVCKLVHLAGDCEL